MSEQHYEREALGETLTAVLLRMAPADHRFSVAELAPLDQFHARGLAATAELARDAGLTSGMRVLDVGSGLGGPARYLASTYGCTVTGVDLSHSFVEAARVLTAHWDGNVEVDFVHGDATRLDFEAETFDAAFLQHVAMNVADRVSLYAGIRRVLRPGGHLALYDVVRGTGEIDYPLPWAPAADASFLLSESETRDSLAVAGFRPNVWRSETAIALAWFDAIATAAPAPNAINLGAVLGSGVAPAVANFRRNLATGAIGIIAAVLERT